MSQVFIIDHEKRPLNPVHPADARHLLKTGQAAVFRRYPFTLILKQRVPVAAVQPLRLKLDPGSKTTGIALLNDATGTVVWAAELTHRGQHVKSALDSRRASRRSRRQRHTRYRQPRFLNRRRPQGWLPPSLESRIQNVLTWVARLSRYASLTNITQEVVRFDLQLMQDAEVSGVAYQQGELQGYEVREYLLEKWHRCCVYCGAKDVSLQVEHIIPRARGGTDRVSNLTLACEPCNQRKGTLTAAEFGFPDIQAQAKAPLRDAAAVNTTRWALYKRLHQTGLPVETGTGGQTKWNRTTRKLSKTHWLDAACVGASTPEVLHVRGVVPLFITATGRHSRQMCGNDAFGFPNKTAKATGSVGGFRTGDIVRAVVPDTSKHVGTYVGRIAIRATGSCNITTKTAKLQGVHYRFCKPLHRGDGYTYG